jgi:hypothetical protein
MSAMQPAKENMCRAEVHRMAGHIAMLLPELETEKAETHFARPLTLARAAGKVLGVARHDEHGSVVVYQGKRQQARDLLAPVYAWFFR